MARKAVKNTSRRANTNNNAGYNNHSMYYSATSEAFDIEPRERETLKHNTKKRPRPDAKSLERTKKQRKAYQMAKQKKAALEAAKTRYEMVQDNKAGITFFSAVTIAIIFLGILSIVFTGVMIAQKRSQIAALRSEYNQLYEANLQKSAKVAQNRDLKEIEKIAVTKLGMGKPKPHQIITITVPKQNYVVQNNTAQKPDNSFVSRLTKLYAVFSGKF